MRSGNSPDIELNLWIFDGMPHLEAEAEFQPLHRDSEALYGDLVCRSVQKSPQRGLFTTGREQVL
jgi:hypothetical protein